MITAIIFIFAFALFDYFGYTYSAHNGKVKTYRVIQYIVQGLIYVTLYIVWDWKVSLAFIILHITFWADWVFYLYCGIFNYYGNRKDMFQLFDNICRWAWWTPFGIIQWLIFGRENLYNENGDYIGRDFRVMHWALLLIQTLIGGLLTHIIFLNT